MSAGAIVAAAVAGALGVYLIVRRDSWARDTYALPDGAAGRTIITVLGALLIVVAVWALVDP